MEMDMQLLLQESPVGFARISLAQDSAGYMAGIEVLDFNPAFARLAGPGFPETWRRAPVP